MCLYVPKNLYVFNVCTSSTYASTVAKHASIVEYGATACIHVFAISEAWSYRRYASHAFA